LTSSVPVNRLPYPLTQVVVHLFVWGELAWITLDLFTHHLSVNPIQSIQQRTGRLAIFLLVLSLACNPLSNLLGWRELLKTRRTLGLYACMAAFIHILIFTDLDNGLAWDFLLQTVAGKPFILLGMAAFLMLLLLAATSFDVWKERLGRKWRKLHQLIYLIAPVAVLHYALARKGDLFRLQGDILQPLAYGLIILALLALRVPVISRSIAMLRHRVTSWAAWSRPRASGTLPAA
jgi:sulfoxide reductase heme-binding subunit YedZ